MARHRLRRVPFIGLTRAQMRRRIERLEHLDPRLASGARLHDPRIRAEDFWGAEMYNRVGGRDAMVPPERRFVD